MATIALLLAAFALLIESAYGGGGFTANLIPCNHQASPFHPDHTCGAIRRSISRTHRLWARHSLKKVQSDMIYSDLAYYMNVSIGSPPLETSLLVDTGSDLLWTQCEPCTKCYRQKLPIFKPRNSSTYKPVRCSSKLCESLPGATCGRGSKWCNYSVEYIDKSVTRGKVALETLRIGTASGSTITLPRIAFGCGHDNHGIFDDAASGIMGLGDSGPFSLISQIEGAIGGRFSYCLVPESRKGTSKISFGEDAVVSGPGVVSTPYFPGRGALYSVNVEGFSVGKTRISYGDNSADSEAKESSEVGEMTIDSGTAMTLVPSRLFNSLESAITAAIALPRVPHPIGQFDLCYKKSPSGKIDVPAVVVHFAGGADIALDPGSTFLHLADLLCVTIEPTNQDSILGNFAQRGFKVGFNVRNKTVSFMAMDCAAQ